METHQEDTLLLEHHLLLPQTQNCKIYAGDASVDIKGNPVLKANTGTWKACPFILSTECCERLAYYGIAINLVSYLTKYLHEGNASAATNITTWAGTCYLTPLIGAFLADAYWGRYWTIAAFSTIYFIGMCTLTLSASVPALRPAGCEGSVCPSATPAQNAVFFLGLYLIALGTGGIKPCVSSFGADQFDDTDPSERPKKGSFFNWYYFSINIGALASSTIIVWIQENAGWGIGFGIPTLFMAIAIASFFSGTPLYRFQKPGGSPLTRICSVTQVEELKRLVQMLPIWATGIVFFAVHVQLPTLSILQGMTMDTTIGSFNIPAASLSSFNVISVLVCVPIYDRVLVPVAKKITGTERGLSELQRMGVGICISTSCMLGAALVETRRLELARGLGLVPMSIMWQVPQYFLMGAAEVFTCIGQMEFFYDQSPDSMRSSSTALALLTTSLGAYLSSFMISVVSSVTGWIPDNLNQGHLDYYFLLLAFIGFLNMVAYLFCSKLYVSKSKQVS
ncbi:PREDICTED: protein NRT1/ PTR FAMILY 8.4-like [Ipomoea nil]|uniref:protein NRT1/ PTR FAMILY 8.4-like n=1 Tax=Ipomoea nil TaxID=35883 RepID=UPI0009013681|nr:PREDICTED: protein NRT1/ PTR FAMILY 8.4-like [Ipomoea nil]